MPFSEKVGFVFNCGFCSTLVYEHCAKIDKNGDSAGKKNPKWLQAKRTKVTVLVSRR